MITTTPEDAIRMVAEGYNEGLIDVIPIDEVLKYLKISRANFDMLKGLTILWDEGTDPWDFSEIDEHISDIRAGRSFMVDPRVFIIASFGGGPSRALGHFSGTIINRS